jgi:hypothetical protein
MTSGTDDKTGRTSDEAGQGRTWDNVVTLVPKSRLRKATSAHAVSPLESERKDRPVPGGDDNDPGPTAA